VCNAPMDLFAISVNIFTSILKNKNVMPSHPLGFILRMRMFQRMCVCVYMYECVAQFFCWQRCLYYYYVLLFMNQLQLMSVCANNDFLVIHASQMRWATKRQLDKQTVRQTDRQTGKQTERHTLRKASG